MLLPKRVARVLSSEVELTEAGKSFGLFAKKRQPIISEISADDNSRKLK
jgi:hypothetical protein